MPKEKKSELFMRIMTVTFLPNMRHYNKRSKKIGYAEGDMAIFDCEGSA